MHWSFADTVLVGGRIITMDPMRPTAEAIAIRDGRIVAVGDESVVRDFRGAATEVVDLRGGVVTPGLIDAHMHPIQGFELAVGIDFGGVRDAETFLAMLRAEARRVADGRAAGGWVRGWNIDYDVFSRLPMTAAAIDDAVEGAPAFLMFFDGHTALASSEALRRAGITGGRRFGDTSEIVVDEQGRPTGALREDSAFDLVLRTAPEHSAAEMRELVRGLLGGLAESGITGACIMDGNPGTLDLLDDLDRTGAGLPLRLVSAMAHNPGYDEERTQHYLAQRDRHGRRWRGGLVKLFNDGVIDTGTGWLYEPDTHGEGLNSFWADGAEFERVVQRYSEAGFQIATHAIGDRAIGTTIDAYLKAGVQSGRGAPHRIEHLELLADRDLARLGRTGITASVQPLHMQWRKADGSDFWAERLGPERAALGWRVRDMIDAGAMVALGSDWPVAQTDARIGLAWARLRREPGAPDAPVFEPDQRLSPYQALQGYTVWAALAQGDRDLGVIAPGYRADLVVWEDSPLDVDADELLDLPVRTTMVDGRPVYAASAA
ncbi:amidohydrolase [Agromyces mediolanus]|uniref:Amidohydrolase n=1 Tax=Agromyces mediolanus TaxID=41986 RepID=A0A918CGI0_AGRME|nr:amidohydrolase [Agromyces mediolanus]GGR22717.1 amidohydrolase [Agromyces mediolanus]GLJ71191.1 amidohydrolase [Agromyces mediolanus]